MVASSHRLSASAARRWAAMMRSSTVDPESEDIAGDGNEGEPSSGPESCDPRSTLAYGRVSATRSIRLRKKSAVSSSSK